MRKKINLRLIKPTYRYFASELASVLGIDRSNVYKMIKDGLPYFEDEKTGKHKILGQEFIDYKKQKRLACKPKRIKGCEFWCFHCRSFARPKTRLRIDDFSNADKNVSAGTILLIGECHRCGNNINQINNISNIDKLKERYIIDN